ncbi:MULTISPECIES: glycoside hydrolase family 32 protein [Arthrobacter]|uniref:Glycoside hydrolase family 32 protein n=1 Tax=Arthrobacter terricola TaxID=2547396 RepID=A0A4R5KQQ9_9MICC|nr:MULTISPECIES: glycoside hydrolase family 32 protein [Arthrobacter]MBT8160905.1 glycoside hydrolase family 32 protein [Arthrobacter sp. GN70]TDF97345.1 glycoside hydrolase family 32 protein [Arthrobacter terricola]
MTEPTSPPSFGEEAYRPQIHYTAADTWINDPNGLVHAGGLYHLFFQNNPYGRDHANMSWGHAVSSDLIHWSDRPVAIPCDDQEQIFSGSVVVDEGNTSGFGGPGRPPLVAVYTSAYAEDSPHHGVQAQSLAYSLDGGDTWAKHDGNPVLDRNSRDFRDPKVFRYTGPAGSYWVMVAVEAVERKAVFYRSDDLLTWSHLSDFESKGKVGHIWECPDMFPLPVNGDPADVKWVLIINFNREEGQGGSAAVYFLGDFDGTTFSPASHGESADDGAADTEYEWLDFGRDYYASVSYNNAPEDRRILVGWMNNWDYARSLPTSPWRGAMALPREAALRARGGRLVLEQRVVPGLESSGPKQSLGLLDVPEGVRSLPLECGTEPCLIEATFDAGSATEFGLVFRQGGEEGTRLVYDVERGELTLDRRASGADLHPLFPSADRAPVGLVGDRLRLRIYLDAGSVEVFAQRGEVTFAEQIFPDPSSTGLSVYAAGGTAHLIGLTSTPLTPAPVVRERRPTHALGLSHR